MSNPQPRNDPKRVAALLAAVRHVQRSCQRCGRVADTLPVGKANFCVECVGHVIQARRQAREVH